MDDVIMGCQIIGIFLHLTSKHIFDIIINIERAFLKTTQ